MSSKLREALSEIIDLIDKWRTDGVMAHWQYSQLFDVADNALAEPLRNCEVGTPEEQRERLEAFCAKHFSYVDDNHCAKCPIFKEDSLPCVYRFLQMPYEKGDDNADE